jgi:hypothetical protein
VNLDRDRADPVHGVLKVSWDLKGLNDHSIHEKLQDCDRDPYLQKTAKGTSQDIDQYETSDEEDKDSDLLSSEDIDQYKPGDEEDLLAARRHNSESIQFPSMWDDEINLRGITIMDQWREPTMSRPSTDGTRVERRRECVTEILRGFMDDTLLQFHLDTTHVEDRERNLTVFKTCGVDILWFGTAREMFHGVIGAMVGRYFEILISSLTHAAG